MMELWKFFVLFYDLNVCVSKVENVLEENWATENLLTFLNWSKVVKFIKKIRLKLII